MPVLLAGSEHHGVAHLDVLRRLLDLDPENVVTCQRLGDLYAKANRTPEALDLAAKLKEAKAAAKAAGVLEEQLSQALKLAIGDAAGIEGVASWKANRDGQKTDWEATARQLFARLAGPMNQQLLDEVIAANTTHKPGARVLRLLGGTT